MLRELLLERSCRRRQATAVFEVAVVKRQQILRQMQLGDFSTGRPRRRNRDIEQALVDRLTTGTAGKSEQADGHLGLLMQVQHRFVNAQRL